MNNKISPITKQLIILQAKRVIEILEDETIDLDRYEPICGELKCKMKELRRDTVRLSKQL